MAVRLRLMRTGRSGQATYRIVAVDGRKRRDGACIEKIGHYNPRTAPPELFIDEAKALKWLKLGASPSETVRSLLSRQGLLLAWDMQKKGTPPDEIQSKAAEFRKVKETGLMEKAKAGHEAAARKRKSSPAVEAVEAVAPISAPEPETSSEESAEPEGTT